MDDEFNMSIDACLLKTSLSLYTFNDSVIIDTAWDNFNRYLTETISKYTPNREVNNRLTGWAFADPVNSTCPLPKIAHPVNYLAHRQMGTTIIKNRVFAKLTNPKGEPHSSTPWIGNALRQYLSAVLKFVNV